MPPLENGLPGQAFRILWNLAQAASPLMLATIVKAVVDEPNEQRLSVS